MNPKQIKILDWLIDTCIHEPVTPDPFDLIYTMTANIGMGMHKDKREVLTELSVQQKAEVLKAFTQWIIKEELKND